MNTIKKTIEVTDVRINVQMKLSALWAALMFLYIYADIFSLFKPGHIDRMTEGLMGPFPVTQGSLLGFSVLMVIPAVMVFLSLALQPRAGALGEHHPGCPLHGCQHRKSGRGDLGFLSSLRRRGDGARAADRPVCLAVAPF
jgi:hypothetical protein